MGNRGGSGRGEITDTGGPTVGAAKNGLGLPAMGPRGKGGQDA